MKPPNHITLSNPCHVPLESMVPDKQGVYCGSCSKTVTDFTLLSDGEVLDILKQLNGKSACGMFMPGQLDRVLVDKRYKTSLVAAMFKRAAGIVMLFQGLASAALAQHTKKAPQSAQHSGKEKRTINPNQLAGRVIDNNTHEPVAGIKVSIAWMRLDTVTDHNGAFTFTLPPIYNDTVTLRGTPIAIGDTATIGDETIAKADIQAGKEIILYRYPLERLPEHKMIAYKKWTTQTIVTGGFNVQRVKGSDGINADDVNVPKPTVLKPTLWQRITHPFKKRTHDSN